MQGNLESIQELRKLFFDKLKLECNNATNLFHPNDIERVKNSDSWLSRFLNHHEGEVKEALTMLWETCEWRKCMKVNEISEQNVCLEYLADGSLFPYGCDKDDKIMLVFKCRMHIKGQKNFDELKRCLIYWFERLERQTNGDQITIFFDMMDTGLCNMDMEFSKYLISLNKQYYPAFLNYILIYEMPWVLNAAFKIIKSWLPARAVQKIKFINRGTIKEYVSPYKMLTNWGGEDEYIFTFTPEIRLELPTSTYSPVSSKSEETKKKTVHFALNHSSAESSPVSTSFRDMRSDSPSANPLLKVIHPDVVHFNWTGSEFVGSINVENVSDKYVLYKIKTTSPDRYRVRPNSGLLQPGISAKITVVLQSGYQVQSILKDKFLILSMVSDRDVNPQEMSDVWKQSENAKVEQHRLKCSVVEPLHTSLSSTANIQMFELPEDLVDRIEQLKNTVCQMCDYNKRIYKDISYRQNITMVILLLLIFCVLISLYLAFRTPFSSLPLSVVQPSCPRQSFSSTSA